MLRPTVLLCGPPGRARHHEALAAAGYRVLVAPDVGGVLAELRHRRADLVLLAAEGTPADLHEVCREVRSLDRVPVMVLGSPDGRGQVEEVVQLMAFAAGADDVVPADVSARLLLARTGAVLRRSVGEPARVAVRRVGPFELDTESRTASVAGVGLDLTRIEFDLLGVLLEHPSRVVPRDELVNRVWGAWFGDDHVVEVHLSRLRAKVAKAGGPRIGAAVRGVGYRLGLTAPLAG